MGSLLAVTLHAFDELPVVTALPVIVRDLGGRDLYGSVFFAYLLTSILGCGVVGRSHPDPTPSSDSDGVARAGTI